MACGRRLGRGTVLALAAAGSLVLPACAENPEQPSTGTEASDVRGPEDLEDPYDGPLTAAFRQDIEAYVDQEVTLEAQVADVLSPAAFTITGRDEEVEPLLVVVEQPVGDLTPGIPVVVAATAQDEFEVAAVEEELGVDLPEGAEEWEGEAYLRASIVENAAPAGQEGSG